MPVLHYYVTVPVLQVLVAPDQLLLVEADYPDVALELMILGFQSLKPLEHLLLRVSLHAHYLFDLAAKLVQVQIHHRLLISLQVRLHPGRRRVLRVPLSIAVLGLLEVPRDGKAPLVIENGGGRGVRGDGLQVPVV